MFTNCFAAGKIEVPKFCVTCYLISTNLFSYKVADKSVLPEQFCGFMLKKSVEVKEK